MIIISAPHITTAKIEEIPEVNTIWLDNETPNMTRRRKVIKVFGTPIDNYFWYKSQLISKML